MSGMEVHAPHHPLHSWRDFFIHIATITIGLLIALGLEASVEALHHRHQRNEARENILNELAGNRKELPDDLGSLVAERHELEQNIELLRQLRNHQAVPPESKLKFSWYWSSLPDAAWQTARETGVLALLPAAQVKQYSGIYIQQALFNESGVALSKALTEAEIPLKVEPDLRALSPAMTDELIRACALGINRIDYAETLARSLPAFYQRALGD